MQRLSFFLFVLLFAGAGQLTAQMGLNPFDWFDGEAEEEALAINVASNADEVAASSLVESGKAALESGNTGRAHSRFKKVIKRYGTTKAAGEARYLRARILMTKGKWKKAFETLQEVVTENPEFEQFNQVISAQFECATALMEGARGRILWIIPGFRQYDEAVRQFETVVRNGPYSDYAPLALMNIALVAEKQDEPDVAIDALDRLINYYPQSMLAPDAYYNMAETYSSLVKGPEYDQGATRQAISYYEDFLILFSESNYVGDVEANLAAMQNLLAESRLKLGDFFYYYRNNNTAALTFYNETVTIAPESEAADEARARIEDVEAGVRPISGAQIVRSLLLID
ncbi:outer membrane protein assembly factor BamD [Coraliomargarita sinensis]|nr:outer membrane protein assembly factor BamD [Coraliomargarita sinensis]